MIGTRFQRRLLPLDCLQCRYGLNAIGNNGHIVCKRCWKWSSHSIGYLAALGWKSQHVCKREDLEW